MASEKERAYFRSYFAANRDKHRVSKHKYYEKSIEKVLVSRAKKRANKFGMEFDLRPEDITVPSTCPVLGIPLAVCHGKSGGGNGSPSLDRIDSKRGYTKDNVLVVSWRANHIKNNSTIEELETVARFYKALLAGSITV
jgi:hypothetical protein